MKSHHTVPTERRHHCHYYSAVQIQKAVSAYFTSKQILLLGFTKHILLWEANKDSFPKSAERASAATH